MHIDKGKSDPFDKKEKVYYNKENIENIENIEKAVHNIEKLVIVEKQVVMVVVVVEEELVLVVVVVEKKELVLVLGLGYSKLSHKNRHRWDNRSDPFHILEGRSNSFHNMIYTLQKRMPSFSQ